MLGYFNYNAHTTKPIECKLPQIIVDVKQSPRKKSQSVSNRYKKKRRKKGSKKR